MCNCIFYLAPNKYSWMDQGELKRELQFEYRRVVVSVSEKLVNKSTIVIVLVPSESEKWEISPNMLSLFWKDTCLYCRSYIQKRENVPIFFFSSHVFVFPFPRFLRKENKRKWYKSWLGGVMLGYCVAHFWLRTPCSLNDFMTLLFLTPFIVYVTYDTLFT